jgi:acetyltransferase-like isoleucine patch superfamily enzyme
MSVANDVYIRSYFCLEAYAVRGSVVVRVGDGVQLGHNVRVVAFNGVEMEELVGIGHGCTIADSVHDWKSVDESDGRALWDTPAKLGRTLLIKKGAFLGNNCVVAGGITIGEWSIVDHNTVVSRDIPARSIVGGYPARVLRARRADGTWDIFDDPPLLEDFNTQSTH